MGLSGEVNMREWWWTATMEAVNNYYIASTLQQFPPLSSCLSFVTFGGNW